jgi:hypothetical protein
MQITVETSNPVDVARALSDFVNGAGTGQKRIEEFVKTVMGEHRTLQQSMFRVMLACIMEWAKKEDHQCDARNKDTIEICKKIAAALDGCDAVRYI